MLTKNNLFFVWRSNSTCLQCFFYQVEANVRKCFWGRETWQNHNRMDEGINLPCGARLARTVPGYKAESILPPTKSQLVPHSSKSPFLQAHPRRSLEIPTPQHPFYSFISIPSAPGWRLAATRRKALTAWPSPSLQGPLQPLSPSATPRLKDTDRCIYAFMFAKLWFRLSSSLTCMTLTISELVWLVTNKTGDIWN